MGRYLSCQSYLEGLYVFKKQKCNSSRIQLSTCDNDPQHGGRVQIPTVNFTQHTRVWKISQHNLFDKSNGFMNDLKQQSGSLMRCVSVKLIQLWLTQCPPYIFINTCQYASNIIARHRHRHRYLSLNSLSLYIYIHKAASVHTFTRNTING